MKRVLIMAGGTGGHIFPGLAIANYLYDRGICVDWLGTRYGLEYALISKTQFNLHCIHISGLRGKGIQSFFLAPFKVLYAMIQAIQIIRRLKPNIVIGMGGFVSGPGGIASYLLGYPLIIHEQNAKAGLTNRGLAYIASKVLEAFPETFAHRARVITVGHPVRSNLIRLDPPEKRFTRSFKELQLLVLGGSRGAQALNELLPKMLRQCPEAACLRIWHQCGVEHFAQTKAAYLMNPVFDPMRVRLDSFIEDMQEAYIWAHLVLCRSGASTLAELCAVGLGAILVPYPFAVDDHQTLNARFMVKEKAALCIAQSELTIPCLVTLLRELMLSPTKCLAMAQAAYGLRQTQAIEKIFKICREISC